MNNITMYMILISLLGAGLMAGTFYAFSTFIIKAIARTPTAEAINTMQSINIVVINRWFLIVFIGTALLSLLLIINQLIYRQTAYYWIISASLLYISGTFLVTVVGNVPLNDELGNISANDGRAAKLWQRYIKQWSRWNHLRTLCSIIATLLFAIGLMKTT